MESMGPDANEEKPGFIKRTFMIPCMKQSWMYGISGGLASGLGYFLFTSNVKRAKWVGLGGMYAVIIGTWITCRYSLHQAYLARDEADRQQKLRIGAEDYKLVDPKDI